jgi:hypothetical protein
MAECWTCANPVAGHKSPSLSSSAVGVCVTCRALACNSHGAVSASANVFECLPCVARPPGGGSGPGGGGGADERGGSGDPGRQDRRVGTAAELIELFPGFTERAARHVPPLLALGPLVVELARRRGTAIDDEEFAVYLIALSLWGGGLPPGDLPDEQGPLLRRNPLVGDVLELRRQDRIRRGPDGMWRAVEQVDTVAEPDFVPAPEVLEYPMGPHHLLQPAPYTEPAPYLQPPPYTRPAPPNVPAPLGDPAFRPKPKPKPFFDI